ncbi:distal tail protein Dit [Anaerotignum sp. MB30-C6]|uniref:distal tail protein Dit n=1 Tax=Anaerotignum sp. MB30-C6 TaxID=3070814 RepID=UPI0027DD9800|nr:distal tail protein Dit [Anaerotignum sp. MB30-C6]WMI80347.1 phage tail family protein [Anaerotignum sp. MB30-C6]
MEPYFIFKGKNSKDMGVLISAMPDIVKPKRREDEITIPGRNGVLTIDEGCYEAYALSVECGKRGTERLGEIVAWLDGSGDLILSTEPDKVYRARISNAISISDVIYLYNSFLVQFKVFPFKYSVNKADEERTLTAKEGEIVTIYNQGTVYSEPIITIYRPWGGGVTLTINGVNYTLTHVDEYVTINSEIQEVYKDSMNKNNSFLAMEFPVFKVGANTISWTGNTTRVEIKPNWRWL